MKNRPADDGRLRAGGCFRWAWLRDSIKANTRIRTEPRSFDFGHLAGSLFSSKTKIRGRFCNGSPFCFLAASAWALGSKKRGMAKRNLFPICRAFFIFRGISGGIL